MMFSDNPNPLLKIVSLALAAIFLFLFLVLLVVGLVNPFWCNVPGINFITCFKEKIGSNTQKSEFVANLDAGSPIAEATPTEVDVASTPDLNYGDLEEDLEDNQPLNQFTFYLKTAIETADYEALGNMISKDFVLAPYGASYTEANPSKDEILRQLQREMEGLEVEVDVSNEARKLAQEEYVVIEDSDYLLLSYGWPKDSLAVLGIKMIDGQYFWSHLILFVPRPE